MPQWCHASPPSVPWAWTLPPHWHGTLRMRCPTLIAGLYTSVATLLSPCQTASVVSRLDWRLTEPVRKLNNFIHWNVQGNEILNWKVYHIFFGYVTYKGTRGLVERRKSHEHWAEFRHVFGFNQKSRRVVLHLGKCSFAGVSFCSPLRFAQILLPSPSRILACSNSRLPFPNQTESSKVFFLFERDKFKGLLFQLPPWHPPALPGVCVWLSPVSCICFEPLPSELQPPEPLPSSSSWVRPTPPTYK